MKLEVLNLTKSFGNKEVLKNINFTFESGKIYGLLGRNGAGKTTFFNCLNDDIKPDEGTFNMIEEKTLGHLPLMILAMFYQHLLFLNS